MAIAQDEAREQIRELIHKYNSLKDHQRSLLSESSVVHQFIDPLFKALGWPIEDPQRYQYEFHTAAGRPDMRLTPESGDVIFVEAKRFGVIQELTQSRNRLDPVLTPSELGLGGMTVDRTPEEQQAINYAFQNNGLWAILTNFERLRLFNARRDWLVLSFEQPGAYLKEFDLLWQLSYEQIGRGGLDALSEQRHRGDVDTAYLSFISEWRERLARDIVTNRAANPWAFDDNGQIRVNELRAVVQRILDRLVVVRFAEDHLVIRPGTLQNIRDLRQLTPYTFTLSEFYGRLYRVFDNRHNSGLFIYGLADKAVISDDTLVGLTNKLYEARYRAMSADIMGNTYEQYLGQALVQKGDTVATADNLETRKKQGSYYTPQVIVRYLIDNSLGRYLYGTLDGHPDGPPAPGEKRRTIDDIAGLRLADPACGSGGFLISAYKVLADFYRSEIARLTAEREASLTALMAQGITTPFDLQVHLAPYRAQLERLQNYPTIILENHLYGVDLDPQAAEIATVNLIMRAIADMPNKDRRLPLILNQNIKIGNSLIGVGANDPRLNDHAEMLAEIRRMRVDLASESDNVTYHPAIARINELIAIVNADLDEDLNAVLGDAARHRPFNWAVEFPEVFVGEDGVPLGEAGGFDIVIGNPPWEVIKPDQKEFYAQYDPLIESKLTARQVSRRIAEIDAAEPEVEALWSRQKQRVEQTAAYFKKTREYQLQGGGDRATHKLFLERGYRLLKDDGQLAYVIPAGVYADAGGKDLRLMLLDEGEIEYLYGFSNERFFFRDVHHAFKFTLLGARKGRQSDGFWATFRINPREAVSPDDLLGFLADEQNRFYFYRDSLSLFDPTNLTVMEFQSQQDYDIAKQMYETAPLLADEIHADWSPSFGQEFHMANDSDVFNQHRDGYLLYEGKMIHQYDPFFAPPNYWINEEEGINRLGKSAARGWHKEYRFAFREVSGAVNERTCIATVLPRHTFSGHTLWVGVTHDAPTLLYFVALLNSFCVDWIIRLKANFHVTLTIMKQVPLPRLKPGDPFFDAIVPRAARLTCIRPEFADLWYEVMGEEWTESRGALDPAERQTLRNELDALVARLYGLSRGDFEHILDSFPLAFPNDLAGRQKKATLLYAYDRFP